jgi:plastocyanin
MVFAINPGKKFEAFKANALGNIDTSSSNPASTTTRGSSTVTSMSTTTHAASATPFTTQSTMFTLSLLPSFTLDTPTGSVPDSATTFSVGSILPSSASAAPSAVPTDMSTDHWVIVGANSQLMFTPSNITAHIGDTITFELRPKNHSVTASSFAQPCTPLSQTNASASGAFNSGFLPMDAGTTNFPTYTIQVNSTNPIWVFSGQPAECAAGMVFSANAPADASFPAFQENAQATNATLPAMNGARAGARHMSSLALAAVPLLLSAFLA